MPVIDIYSLVSFETVAGKAYVLIETYYFATVPVTIACIGRGEIFANGLFVDVINSTDNQTVFMNIRPGVDVVALLGISLDNITVFAFNFQFGATTTLRLDWKCKGFNTPPLNWHTNQYNDSSWTSPLADKTGTAAWLYAEKNISTQYTLCRYFPPNIAAPVVTLNYNRTFLLNDFSSYTGVSSPVTITNTSVSQFFYFAVELEAAVSYRFWGTVTTVTGEGLLWSKSVLTDSAIPETPPRNLRGLLLDTYSQQSTLAFAWEQAFPLFRQHGYIVAYEITYRPNDNIYLTYNSAARFRVSKYPLQTVNISGNITNYTLSGLIPGSTYIITVAARTSADTWGPIANVTMVTSIGAPGTPPAPLIVNGTGTSVLISWAGFSNETSPVTKLQIIVEPLHCVVRGAPGGPDLAQCDADSICQQPIPGLNSILSDNSVCGGWCNISCPAGTVLPNLTDFLMASSHYNGALNNTNQFYMLPSPYVTLEIVFNASFPSTAGGYCTIGDGTVSGLSSMYTNPALTNGSNSFRYRFIVFTDVGSFAVGPSAVFQFPPSVGQASSSFNFVYVGAAAGILVLLILGIFLVRRRWRLKSSGFLKSRQHSDSVLVVGHGAADYTNTVFTIPFCHTDSSDSESGIYNTPSGHIYKTSDKYCIPYRDDPEQTLVNAYQDSSSFNTPDGYSVPHRSFTQFKQNTSEHISDTIVPNSCDNDGAYDIPVFNNPEGPVSLTANYVHDKGMAARKPSINHYEPLLYCEPVPVQRKPSIKHDEPLFYCEPVPVLQRKPSIKHDEPLLYLEPVPVQRKPSIKHDEPLLYLEPVSLVQFSQIEDKAIFTPRGMSRDAYTDEDNSEDTYGVPVNNMSGVLASGTVNNELFGFTDISGTTPVWPDPVRTWSTSKPKTDLRRPSGGNAAAGVVLYALDAEIPIYSVPVRKASKSKQVLNKEDALDAEIPIYSVPVRKASKSKQVLDKEENTMYYTSDTNKHSAGGAGVELYGLTFDDVDVPLNTPSIKMLDNSRYVVEVAVMSLYRGLMV